MFEYPSWWCCLGRLKKCGFERGSVSLSFEHLKPHTIPSSLSLLHACGLRRELAVCCCSSSVCLLFPHSIVMNSYPSGAARPKNPFLLQVALVRVFYQSNRRVTNAEAKMEPESGISLNSLLATKVPSKFDRLHIVRILDRIKPDIPRDRHRRGKHTFCYHLLRKKSFPGHVLE